MCLVLIDMDGTLLDSPSVYAASIRGLAKSLVDAGYRDDEDATYAEILRFYNDLYWRIRKLGGHVRLDDALVEFVRKVGAVELISTARELGSRPYTAKIPLRDGALEVIHELKSRGHVVVVYTEGNLKKLAKHRRLLRLIDEAVELRPKTPERLRALVRELGGWRRKEVIVVGDSLSADVAVANRCGYTSVYIRSEVFADSPRERRSRARPDYVISSLRELLEVVEEVCGNA